VAVYLKSVAVLVVLFGVLSGAGFAHRAVRDEEFFRARLVRERNAGNILFESEFRVALAGHIFLIYSAASCFLMALMGGSLLWGLGALHTKIDAATGGREPV
jgi:hypothetical protein